MRSFVFFLLATIIYQGQATFDCRRPQQSCKNGGTCSYTSPLCTGCAGFEGDDCGLETAQKDQGACITLNPCVAGDCYDDAGTAKCYCPDTNYGDTCNENRFAVFCEVDRMVLGVNPFLETAFTGIAYIEGKREEANCVAGDVPAATSADNIPDEWLGQALDVPHTSADCDPITASNVGGKTVYTRNLVVQYDSNLVTSLDDMFEAKCVFDENGVLIENTVTRVDRTDLTGLKKTVTEGTFTPVTLDLESEGATVESATPLVVGSEVVFTFTVPAEYGALRVLEGKANNADDADLKELMIIENSCMHADAYHITKEVPTQGSSLREVIMKLNAFHFYGRSEVTFQFTVKICLPSNVGDCAAIDCNGVSQLGRRKREATAANETTIEQVITVLDPEQYKELEEKRRAERECPITGEITAAMIAMGIVILALLTLCIILLVKAVLSRNARAQSKQDLFSAQSVQSVPRI